MNRALNYLPDLPNCQWEDGTIYYIMSSETGRMKIGFTKGDVTKRLKALQTGSPTKLSVVAIHPGTPDTERSIHAQFASDRMHGEWFDVSPELMLHCRDIYDLIINLAKHGNRIPPEWAVQGRDGVQKALEALVAEWETDHPEDGETVQ